MKSFNWPRKDRPVVPLEKRIHNGQSKGNLSHWISPCGDLPSLLFRPVSIKVSHVDHSGFHASVSTKTPWPEVTTTTLGDWPLLANPDKRVESLGRCGWTFPLYLSTCDYVRDRVSGCVKTRVGGGWENLDEWRLTQPHRQKRLVLVELDQICGAISDEIRGVFHCGTDRSNTPWGPKSGDALTHTQPGQRENKQFSLIPPGERAHQ